MLVSVRVSWGLLYVKTTAHSAVRLGRQNLCCPGNRKFSFSTSSFQAHFQTYFASLQRITKRRKRKSSRPDIGVLEVVCLHRMMQVQAFMADSEVDPDALIRVGCVPRARGRASEGGLRPAPPDECQAHTDALCRQVLKLVCVSVSVPCLRLFVSGAAAPLRGKHRDATPPPPSPPAIAAQSRRAARRGFAGRRAAGSAAVDGR